MVRPLGLGAGGPKFKHIGRRPTGLLFYLIYIGLLQKFMAVTECSSSKLLIRPFPNSSWLMDLMMLLTQERMEYVYSPTLTRSNWKE